MITNDTGPRHLSVATGTPVITLYGPTDFRWTKYACKNDVALLAEPFLLTKGGTESPARRHEPVPTPIQRVRQ